VIVMIGWFWGDDILLDLFPAGPEVRAKVEGSQAGVKWEGDHTREEEK
jgi:hypothetical protein